jgi:outer membrane scaffolding protein for murein synthesis (MipA/OmpV family)
MRYHSLPLAAALLAAAGTAQAQDKSFSGVIGVGVATLPKYVGSDEYRVLPIPVVQLEYKGRLFLGGSPSGVGVGLGAHLVRTSSFAWDVGYAGSEARPEKRGDALAGMGKRSAGSFASSGVSYRFGAVLANAGVGVGLGKDQGSYGTVGLATERQLARRWVGSVSTGATFADGKNMAFDFGVTTAQSAARQALIAAGDPRLQGIDAGAYSPDAGLKEVRGAAQLAYLLTERTRAVAFAQGTHLSNEAARSPIVRERTGVTTGVALAYGF